MSFVIEQLLVSTAEDEQNYFSGYVQYSIAPVVENPMPSGVYRVVDGTLYHVLPTASLTETDQAALSEHDQAERQ